MDFSPSVLPLGRQQIHIWRAGPHALDTANLDSASFRRHVLAAYLSAPVAAVRITGALFERPRLASPHHLPIQFSTSHAAGWHWVAVARDQPVGIDAEHLNSNTSFGAPEQVLSPPERTHLRKLPPERRWHEFLLLWTRKEAWTKATGEGFARDFAQLNVLKNNRGWMIENVNVMPNWVVAVAAPGPRWKIRLFEFHAARQVPDAAPLSHAPDGARAAAG